MTKRKEKSLDPFIPNEGEVFLPVVGYEELYQVSNCGRVLSLAKHFTRPRILRHGFVTGYPQVALWADGKSKSMCIHILMARAFMGKPPPKKEVNHIDGIKTNCHLSNLEYVTRGENVRHAYRLGLNKASDGWMQMLYKRRKPRSMVGCACGCGVMIETPDSKGRNRRYVHGHNGRMRHGSTDPAISR